MVLAQEDIAKLLLAILIGGLIGAEREFRDKAAGFRTIIFISVGACMFTIFSQKLGGDEDPVRIAASIVSGVGFLGAGAILRDTGRIVGLTTASTIWLTAALGMGVGGGHYVLSSAAVAAVSAVLWVFPRVEAWIDDIREWRSYEIACELDIDLDRLEALFSECGVGIIRRKRCKAGETMVCVWQTLGSPEQQDAAVDRLFAYAGVKGFEY